VGKDQTVRYGTDSRLNLFQAINCLATIIQSLRDKGAPRQSPHRRFAHSPFRRFASLRDGSSHRPIPGNPAVTGCLATILLSLRDKAPEPLTGLNPLAGRSLVDTKDLLDIFPGRLPFAIVHVNVGLAAAGQVALKGVRFCSEQVVGVDDFGHKGNILALDSP